MASQLTAGRRDRHRPTSTMNSNIGPWLALKERGVVFRTWEIDSETLHARARGSRPADDRAHPAGLRHARLQPARLDQPDPRDRRFRACARRAAFASTASPMPRTGPSTCRSSTSTTTSSRFYKTFGPHYAVMYGRHDLLLELDGLYHYFYGKEKVPESWSRATRATNSSGVPPASSTISRRWAAGHGRAGHRAAHSTTSRRMRPRSASGCLSWLRARNGVRIIGASRRRRRHCACPTISFTVDGHAPQRHRRPHRRRQARRTPRRFPFAPSGRGAGPRAVRRHPRLDGALQHHRGGRPTDRSAGRRDALGRLNMSCGRPTGRTPRPW